MREIYQLLQKSPAELRQKIASVQGAEKRFVTSALILRDVLLLAFAIFYISLFNYLFGSENSSIAVGSFCMLLGLRFVSFDYQVTDSIVALGIVLSLIFFVGILWPIVPIALGWLLNFAALLLTLMLTTSNPKLGNGGIYAFSYIFIVGTPVQQSLIMTRGLALLTVFVLLSLVLLRHHRYTALDRRLSHVIRAFDVRSKTSLWQLRLALGISIALTTAQLLHAPRAVWMGYAAMSILLPQSDHVMPRAGQRLLGVLGGSLLFALLMKLVPVQWQFAIGPLGGLGLGLTANYFGHSVLNCFGALTMAYTLFGLKTSVLLRVVNNFGGIAIALLCTFIFSWIYANYLKSEKKDPQIEQ